MHSASSQHLSFDCQVSFIVGSWAKIHALSMALCIIMGCSRTVLCSESECLHCLAVLTNSWSLPGERFHPRLYHVQLAVHIQKVMSMYSLSYLAADRWNSAPSDIRTAASPSLFRHALLSFLDLGYPVRRP